MAQDNHFKKYGIDTTGHIPVGLDIGDSAPDFTAMNQFGDSVNLKEELKKGPVVLFFYRGYWCPKCSKHLQAMEDSIQMITDSGAVVIAVSPQVAKYTQKTVDKHKITFQTLSDSTNAISKAYDVLFDVTKGYNRMIKFGLMSSIAKANGAEEAQLPVPATFIINQEGIITYRQFDYNYSNRASVKEISEHLKGL